MISTTLRVTDDDVLRADVFQHFGRGFAGKCARQVNVNVLRAKGDMAAGHGMFSLIQIDCRRGNRHTTTVHTRELFTQVSDQLVYHMAAAVQFPVTHH